MVKVGCQGWGEGHGDKVLVMIGGHKVGVKFWGSGVKVRGRGSESGEGIKVRGSRSETLGSDGRWGLVVGEVGDK